MKAKIIITFEYDLINENYPENSTPEEQVQIDVSNFKSDIAGLLMVLEDTPLEIRGEVTEG